MNFRTTRWLAKYVAIFSFVATQMHPVVAATIYEDKDIKAEGWLEAGTGNSWDRGRGGTPGSGSGSGSGSGGGALGPKYQSLPPLHRDNHDGNGPSAPYNPPLYGRGTSWGSAGPDDIRAWRAEKNKLGPGVHTPQAVQTFQKDVAQTIYRSEANADRLRDILRTRPEIEKSLDPAVRSASFTERPFTPLAKVADSNNLSALIDEVSRWREEARAYASTADRKTVGEYWEKRLRESYVNSNGLLRAFGDTRQFQVPAGTDRSIVAARALNHLVLAEKILERRTAARAANGEVANRKSAAVENYLQESDRISAALLAWGASAESPLDDSDVDAVADQYARNGKIIANDDGSSSEDLAQFSQANKNLLSELSRNADFSERAENWHRLQNLLRDGAVTDSSRADTTDLIKRLRARAQEKNTSVAALDAAQRLVDYSQAAATAKKKEATSEALAMAQDLLASHAPSTLSLGGGPHTFGKLARTTDPVTAKGFDQLSELMLEGATGAPDFGPDAKFQNLADVARVTQGEFLVPATKAAGAKLRDGLTNTARATALFHSYTDRLPPGERAEFTKQSNLLSQQLGMGFALADKMWASNAHAATALIDQLAAVASFTAGTALGVAKGSEAMVRGLIEVSRVVGTELKTALTGDSREVLYDVDLGLQKLYNSIPKIRSALEKLAHENAVVLRDGNAFEKGQVIGRASFEIATLFYGGEVGNVGEVAEGAGKLAEGTVEATNIVAHESAELALDQVSAESQLLELEKAGEITPILEKNYKKFIEDYPDLAKQALAQKPAGTKLADFVLFSEYPEVVRGLAQRSRIVKAAAEDLEPLIGDLKALDPEATFGLRGSLASGWKNNITKWKEGVRPAFNPESFDIDAFVVSDKLAQDVRFGNARARFANRLPELSDIERRMQAAIVKNPAISGLRGEGISIRVWTKAEIELLKKSGDFQLFFKAGVK